MRSDAALFFFVNPVTTNIYTLSLHDALPIYIRSTSWTRDAQIDPGVLAFTALATILCAVVVGLLPSLRLSDSVWAMDLRTERSEEHTSELQSRRDLVCRLLLEKKKECSLLTK